VVECQLPKLKVGGSNPLSRSTILEASFVQVSSVISSKGSPTPWLQNKKTALKTFGSASLCSGGIFDIEGLEALISEADAASQADGFWDNPDSARQSLTERARLKDTKDSFEKPWARFEDLEAMLELISEEDDDSELQEEFAREIAILLSEVGNLEFQRMMGGEEDKKDGILTINAGAGGTESLDWAEMLLRMYLRYCERKGFKVLLIDRVAGEEAGIKSATLEIQGAYAFGFLKPEAGVHRLVRISPFDAQNRRHTSFASVYTCPVVDDSVVIEIADSDLRIDTFRASGAGGQHVNRTDSAVRLTHLSTGIVVSCQNERSQHKNRATAMKIMKSRLYDLEMEKKREAQAEVEASKMAINFGSQIRSYVLHPYRMVKDHRTNFEAGNADAVLDGDLEPFIKAYLMMDSQEGKS
jgi:peptide chain release factor 2